MNAKSLENTPEPVKELARACENFVQKALNVQLDYTQDTLSILDHYLQLAHNGAVELHRLVGAAAGAYFGEVLRSHFSARWAEVKSTDNCDHWRIEFSQVFLWLNPVVLARESLQQEDVVDGGAGFQVLQSEREVLTSALKSLGDVDSDEFYKLTTRYDVLSSVVDRLTILRQRALNVTDELPVIDSATYRATVDSTVH